MPDLKTDIAKSSNWLSLGRGWKGYLDRELLFSVRFYRLLKAVKAKGIVEATCQGETKPTSDEKNWVKAKVAELPDNGIVSTTKDTISLEARQWFRRYLEANSRQTGSIDFLAFERQQRLTLPTSYKEFVDRVGLTTFANADGEEDVQVRILPPDRFDLKSYRRGRIGDDEESKAVDGVMFAKTQFGDCYCFDVSQPPDEYPIYVYLHEMNCFEAFAPNFIEFLRRVTQS